MRRLALLLAALAFVVGAAACGGGDDETATPETVEGTLPTETAGTAEGDAAAGKAIFSAQGCGGCHEFAAAGSSGTIGPNLDESSVDFQAAVTQVTNGGGGMPAFKDRITEKEIADVAAFVTEERAG